MRERGPGRSSAGGAPPSWYRTAIVVYDWMYRVAHRLNTPASEVGPVLLVEIRRSHRTFHLSGVTVVRLGDRIGVLHLNNDRVATLRSDGLSPLAVGLEFRRRLIASLQSLAALSAPGGRLADVRAFTATTIFHEGLRRLGFETELRGLGWPKRVVAAYQRALLMSLHGRRSIGLHGSAYQRAERVWIAREKLIRRYGPSVSVRRWHP